MKSIIPAIAFDSNGVLIQSTRALPRAKEALDLAASKNIPFCIVTNASGRTDGERAAHLNKLLGVDYFTSFNIIQGSSAMKDIY